MNEIKEKRYEINNQKNRENFWGGLLCVCSLWFGIYIGQGYLGVDTLINYVCCYGSYALGLVLAGVIGVFGYKNSKSFDKKINELKIECEDLKVEIDKATEKLNEYKNNKSKDLEHVYKNKKFNKLIFIHKMNEELKIIRKNLEEIKNSRIENNDKTLDKGLVLKKVINEKKD